MSVIPTTAMVIQCRLRVNGKSARRNGDYSDGSVSGSCAPALLTDAKAARRIGGSAQRCAELPSKLGDSLAVIEPKQPTSDTSVRQAMQNAESWLHDPLGLDRSDWRSEFKG